MRLTYEEIVNGRAVAGESHSLLSRNDDIYAGVNGLLVSYSAQYHSTMLNNAPELLGDEHTLNNDKATEEERQAAAEDIQEIREGSREVTNRYKMQLIGMYRGVQEKIQSHGRLHWLLHPIDHRHEQKALAKLNEKFSEMNMSKKEIEGLMDLTDDKTPVPQAATIDENGLTINVDEAVGAPAQQAIDLGEEEPEREAMPVNEAPSRSMENSLDNSR